MPHYRYAARTWKGQPEEGTLEAPSLYDFYAEMSDRQLQVVRVVDVTGVVDEPPPPPRRLWPTPVFAVLLVLLAGLIAGTWLPIPFRSARLLLPALAALTLAALLAWQRARPGPLLAPHLMDDLVAGPTWLHTLLALILAAALGQFAALVAEYGLVAPPVEMWVRGLLGAGVAVPLLVIGSGLAAGMRGKLN